jgi:tetratricopeptide (TPR) repeat protein
VWNPNEWLGFDNRLSEATLVHYGYTPETTRRREKIGRNLRLLQRALKEQPGDPNLLMNLGLELVRSDRRTEGIARYCEAFHRLSAMPTDQVVPELRETLLTQFSTHLMAGRRFKEAAQVLQSPLAKTGGLTASLHLTLGLALMEAKQFAAAAEEFRQCVAKRGRPALTPIDQTFVRRFHTIVWPGLWRARRWEAAEKSFKDALREDPGSIPVRVDFARYLQQRGQAVEAPRAASDLSHAAEAEEVWNWEATLHSVARTCSILRGLDLGSSEDSPAQ